MTDLIPVSVAMELLPYISDSQNAPASLSLEIDRVGSSAGLNYVGKALRSNNSISWFSVELGEKDMSNVVDNMEYLLKFYHQQSLSESARNCRCYGRTIQKFEVYGALIACRSCQEQLPRKSQS